jgi:predicted alpha/beta-hydrolase family hydrolase
MAHALSEPVRIALDASQAVSGLWQRPADARACYVLAHGAGAGMAHPFMAAVADGLGERGIATLRYQFAYMERGSKRPDLPKLAHAAVRAAVDEAQRLGEGLPLFAGGKSFGGRMTSQAQAQSSLPGVRGIVFLGFPLHPAGTPSDTRAEHLAQVRLPMLFLQGTRDELADAPLMRAVVQRLGEHATLAFFEDADHSFHVPARSGGSDAQVRARMLDTMAGWIDAVLAR